VYNYIYIYILFIHSFWNIYSFILETYTAPLQETTTQNRSQPSHGERRRTWQRCTIWRGGSLYSYKGSH